MTVIHKLIHVATWKSIFFLGYAYEKCHIKYKQRHLWPGPGTYHTGRSRLGIIQHCDVF